MGAQDLSWYYVTFADLSFLLLNLTFGEHPYLFRFKYLLPTHIFPKPWCYKNNALQWLKIKEKKVGNTNHYEGSIDHLGPQNCPRACPSGNLSGLGLWSVLCGDTCKKTLPTSLQCAAFFQVQLSVLFYFMQSWLDHVQLRKGGGRDKEWRQVLVGSPVARLLSRQASRGNEATAKLLSLPPAGTPYHTTP